MKIINLSFLSFILSCSLYCCTLAHCHIIPLNYYSDHNLPFGLETTLKSLDNSTVEFSYPLNFTINTNTPFTIAFDIKHLTRED